MTDIQKEALDWLSNYAKGFDRIHIPTPTVCNMLQRNFGINEEYEFEDGCLYRGLYFPNEKELISFINTLKDGILTEEKITSWTEDSCKALDFMHGAGYEYYNGETDDGYGIRISICPNPKDVIFSWKIFLDWIERNNMEVESNVIKLVSNDSEFLIMQGSYEVIFTHAHEKVQPMLEKSKVFENCQEVIKYIQYV